MKIVIPGGSGQVGTLLARHFRARGDDLVVIARHVSPAAWPVVPWDGRTQGAWAREIDGADVVINMAGRNVNCRYTSATGARSWTRASTRCAPSPRRSHPPPARRTRGSRPAPRPSTRTVSMRRTTRPPASSAEIAAADRAGAFHLPRDRYRRTVDEYGRIDGTRPRRLPCAVCGAGVGKPDDGVAQVEFLESERHQQRHQHERVRHVLLCGGLAQAVENGDGNRLGPQRFPRLLVDVDGGR